MPGRKEIIKAWENVLSRDPLDVAWDLIDETLTLLKENDSVKPVKKDVVEVTARYEYDCQCGAPLLIGQPYCADCGRLVNWDE